MSESHTRELMGKFMYVVSSNACIVTKKPHAGAIKEVGRSIS